MGSSLLLPPKSKYQVLMPDNFLIIKASRLKIGDLTLFNLFIYLFEEQ